MMMINHFARRKETKWQQRIVEIARNFIFKSWSKKRRIQKGSQKVRRESYNRAKAIMKE